MTLLAIALLVVGGLWIGLYRAEVTDLIAEIARGRIFLAEENSDKYRPWLHASISTFHIPVAGKKYAAASFTQAIQLARDAGATHLLYIRDLTPPPTEESSAKQREQDEPVDSFFPLRNFSWEGFGEFLTFGNDTDYDSVEVRLMHLATGEIAYDKLSTLQVMNIARAPALLFPMISALSKKVLAAQSRLAA